MTRDLRLEGGQETLIHQRESTVELHRDGAVSVGRARVDIRADGKIETHPSDDGQPGADGAVHLHPAASDSTPAQAADRKPGDRMPDGTIFAGISPDTGRPMYAAPADAPLTMKWKAAMKYAAKLDAYGHHDWRVPTKAELNVLYENRDKGALKGTFNVTGSHPAGWYWSSTEIDYGYYARGQHFSDGDQGWYGKGDDSSLRCVR